MDAVAQPVAPCIPIWQGFSQDWGYNHRINRLGDYVKGWPAGDSCMVQGVHTAASGSGSDLANFKQFYSTAQSELLESYEGSTSLTFTGKEGEYLADVQLMDIELPSANDSTAAYEVVLNGFDLVTANGAKADKMHTLDIAIDSVWRDIPQRKIWFRIRAGIQFSCSSGECEPLNQVVDYALEVHFLVLGGHGFYAQRCTFGGGRNWGKEESRVPPLTARVAMLGDGRFTQATPGIRGLHFQLDREHHMLRIDAHIQPHSYEPGLLLADMCMAFAQNDLGMRELYKTYYDGRPKLPAAWVVKRENGSVAWEMDVTLLQFESVILQESSRIGQIKWKAKHGEQSAADGDGAENKVILEVRNEQ